MAADAVQGSRAYEAAAKIQQLARSIGEQAPQIHGNEGAAMGESLFQQMIRKRVEKVREAVNTSEGMAQSLLQDDGSANPVATVLATQEASYQVELASETMQRLVKMFDEMLKIAL